VLNQPEVRLVDAATWQRLQPCSEGASQTVVSHITPCRKQAPSRQPGAWQDNGLVFTTKTGRPVEPRNLVRSFHRICTTHGLLVIKVHHLRHTTATLLKNLGVPARDAQLILGHSRLAVTQEIYTHDRQAQHDALNKISAALRNVDTSR
jgi:site-specific recombinase XerD